MGIKYKTTASKFPDMIKQVSVLNGKKIDVGVLEGKHQWLAAIHEYGCNITVTPKMRAYLHSQGLHLSPNTTTIRIPERSFLRTGHDENIEDVMGQVDKAIPSVLSGKMSEKQLYDLIGQILSSKIKTYAVKLSSPPNTSFTISRKNSSNPLVDTGDMINGITWRVK